MSQFDAGAWASTDANANTESNDPPAPGKYQVVVAGAKAFTSKAGNDIALVEWKITGGPLTDYQWPDLYGFKNDGQIKAAKSMCSRLGIDVESVSALEDLNSALEGVIGEYFTVEVVQNGSYLNTYIQGKASSDIPDDGSFEPVAAGSAAPVIDEDIPF